MIFQPITLSIAYFPIFPLLRNTSTPASSSQARDIGRMHPLRLFTSMEIFNKNAVTGNREDRAV